MSCHSAQVGVSCRICVPVACVVDTLSGNRRDRYLCWVESQWMRWWHNLCGQVTDYIWNIAPDTFNRRWVLSIIVLFLLIEMQIKLANKVNSHWHSDSLLVKPWHSDCESTYNNFRPTGVKNDKMIKIKMKIYALNDLPCNTNPSRLKFYGDILVMPLFTAT